MNELMKLLECDDIDQFKLKMLETVGMLVLMSHWMRGIVDSLVRNGSITLTDQQLSNWDRIIKDLSLYEEFIWEIAPPRTMLLALRQYRVTGELVDNVKVLMKSDTHGRIPYGLDMQTLDDIEDIVRRLKDARQITGYGHGVGLNG